MSQEVLEIVGRAIEAWNRLDLATFVEAWHPEAERPPAFPTGTEGTGLLFKGKDGIRDAWDNVRAAWSLDQVEPEEVRMVGPDLLVLGRSHARGVGSEIEVRSAWSAVVRFRDGKLISAWDWLDHESALEAVGLSE